MASFLFGTVGSPLSSPKKPGGSVSGILRTSELGLTCMEIGWVRSVNVREETCYDIRDYSKQMNIPLSVHAPYYVNLNAGEDEWPKSRERLLKACRLGFMAGATDIIFHPGSYMGKSPEIALLNALDRLNEISNQLSREDNPVVLRPETMGKQGLLGSFSDVITMCKTVEGVYPCLDAAHLYARSGDGSLNDTKSWEEILSDYARNLGEDSLKSMHIHVSGIQYSDRGEIKHLPVRESDFCYKCLFSALKSFDCAGRILCESPLMEDDAIYLRDIFTSI